MGNLENDESQKIAPTMLLGEYLKEKRLEKNFSLEKLSQKTKISVNILKSLEVNDYKSLPSAAYIKGFVTSYVKVLGLPLDEAISKMEYTYQNLLNKPFPSLNHTKLMTPVVSTPAPLKPATTTPAAVKAAILSANKAKNVERSPSPHEVITSGDSIIQGSKSILPLAIFASIILLFIGGYKLVSSVVEGEVSGEKSRVHGPRIETSSALVNPSRKKVEALKTPAEITTPAPGATAPVTTNPATATSSAAGTTTTTATTVAPVAEVAVETKPLQPIQRNFPPVKFSKVKGNLFVVKTDAPENSNLEILPESAKARVNPQLQNVYIRATDGNTWMSYKIDNKPISSVIINQGNDIFLQGSEIRVFLGNVNVTKIFFNNYLIETPNKAGVKSLVFPEANADKYSLPLFPKAKDDIFYTAEEYMKRMKMEEEELGKKAE